MDLVLIIALFAFALCRLPSNKLQKCNMTVASMKSLNVTGGSSRTPAQWSLACSQSAVADFAKRDLIPDHTPCQAVNSWGPEPTVYPTTSIPANCDRRTWMQYRVSQLIPKFVAKGWNYCHHHAPTWMPPKKYQIPINPTQIAGAGGNNGTCSSAGIHGKSGWQGIDCTHYTSWIYNYGFGAHLASLTGDQACGPDAPGRVLPYTAQNQSQFQVGDILFIAANGAARPMHISHGVLWTGIKLTYDNGPFSNSTLIQNVPSNQQALVLSDIAAARKNGQDVYVISDSHNAGPNFRPFAGWWAHSFTFARRLIEPDTRLPTTAPGAVYSSGSCNYTPPSSTTSATTSTSTNSQTSRPATH